MMTSTAPRAIRSANSFSPYPFSPPTTTTGTRAAIRAKPAASLRGLDRFLEPAYVKLGQILGHDDRRLDVEAAVAIDQEGHVRPDGVPDRSGAPYAGTG